MKLPSVAICIVFVSFAAAAPLRADVVENPQLTELSRKVDALTAEIEQLKLGGATEAPASLGRTGKVSLGGYGEFVFRAPSRRAQNGDATGLKKQTDLQRFVLYAGYKFNDWILFNSEFEVEHAGTGQGDEKRGEIGVEQAYLEARPWKQFGARAGHVIVPLGLVNEIHEPTAFHGVNRPSVETLIIPSTWHQNGIGVFGEVGPVSYRSYALESLIAVKSADPASDGFTASKGIRGASAEGSNSPADDLAWASRIDVAVAPGVKAGAGLYLGRADRGSSSATVPVTLWEAHAEGLWRGASVRALYAEGRIGNVGDLNAAQGFAGNQSVGRRLFGGYAEAAFDILTLVRDPKGQSLSPFVRYERYDTQWKVPAGFTKDPANSRVEYTLGLTYKPLAQIAVKLDQQWKLNQARTGVNQWNFGLGYIF